MAQRLSVVMLVTLLMTGAVAYYAPHRYAYKITAFLGLVPLAVTLGSSGDRNQMFLSGLILLLAGVPALRACARARRAGRFAQHAPRPRGAHHGARHRARPAAGGERGARRGDERARQGAAEREASPRRSCACTSSARRSRVIEWDRALPHHRVEPRRRGDLRLSRWTRRSASRCRCCSPPMRSAPRSRPCAATWWSRPRATRPPRPT